MTIESHRLAADDVRGVLLPVGAAWRAAIKRDSNIALYSADGFHPSALGSFLAAWIIYEKIYGSSPELPARLKIESSALKQIQLTPSQMDTLRAAVREAIQN